MFNEDGKIAVIFNGEIYNHKILRKNLEEKGHKFSSKCDTEVILHGYEEYGEKISSLLEGMFAFVLLDIKKKKLILSRDRIGQKPLYYYHKNGKLIFASEIKAILLDEEVEREIDYQCLSDYLTLRYSQGGKTIFKEIKKLEPGKYIVYEKYGIKIKSYWSLPKFTNKSKPSVTSLDKLISSAIEKRLMSDVPIGVFLSGGLDSSSIVAYLSKFTENIRTFSIGFNHPTDETKYARIIADKFNTKHTEINSSSNILKDLPKVVWHFDEPMADPASLPTYILSKEVSKNVKVVLAGEGGDEVFGGYQALNYIKHLYSIKKIPGIIRKKIMANVLLASSNFFEYPRKQILKLSSEILKESDNPKESYKKMCYFPFEKEKSMIFPDNKKLNFQTNLDLYLNKNRDLKNGAFEYYFKEYLPNDLLMKADKMGMAASLEIRSPYLDIDLVNYSIGLNNRYKQERYLFRKTVGKYLPRIIMKKKKQGFTLPLSKWFSKEEFNSVLSPHFEDLLKRKILEGKELKKIINNPKGFKNDHRLWVLLNFELWNKIYIDSIPHKKIKI